MKTFVILGIALLAASIAGAVWVQNNQSSSISGDGKNGLDPTKPPERVVCWGYFDVEAGVAQLHAEHYGKIKMVLPEHSHVKVESGVDTVLLQIDDTLAQLDVKRAKADVTVAEKQLAQARQLTKLYQYQREEQEAAIRAVGHDREAQKQQLERDLDSVKGTPQEKNARALFAQKMLMFDEKKKAEEAKLEQLKSQDSQLKIDQAKADLDAKQLRVEQAEAMLKHYQIIAPSSGTILRVNVRKGETLGPNAMKHAVEFLPDGDYIVKAEVLQEWGRYIREGQSVEIEDDTFNGPKWTGKVKSKAKWYSQARSQVIEPLRYNDVRTLDCVITINPGGTPKVIGQRVRVKVKID